MKFFQTYGFGAVAAVLFHKVSALESRPFGLVLISDNSTINGTLLGACHEGAAIDGLCLTAETATLPLANYTTFYHNVTDSSANSTIPDSPDLPGTLTYKWSANGGTLKVESKLALVYYPGSNVATPIFFPGSSSAVYVNFDNCNELYISRSLDDTTIPPKYLDSPAKDFNWYICTTYYGYVYRTLAWRVGSTGEPQNPSCQKVRVKAVFLTTAA